MPRNAVSTLVLLIVATTLMGRAIAASGESQPVDWTRTPMRALPQSFNRPLDPAAAAWFVDGANGNDGAQGTRNAPWKTIAHGLKQLKPGETLVLRGGIYYETLQTSMAGTKDAPLTVRAFPNELVILDGGYREFAEDPGHAWEPFPHGAPGEYRSVKAYPDLGQNPHPRRDVYAMGNFATSMVPLHGYHSLLDLRTDNATILDDNMTNADGVYCGPGVWYDAFVIHNEVYGTKRIHIRLAPTHFDYLGPDQNYRGETDPRKLPLVICGPKPVIQLDGARYLRFQDLVLRGSANHTIDIRGGEGIVLDGLSVFGGAPALRFTKTSGLRVIDSAFRGLAAPWTSRYAQKYRGVSAYLLEAVGDSDAQAVDQPDADSRDVEIANCEFTDSHDGLAIHAIHSLKFHHNLVENFNDDGIEPGPQKKERYVHIYNNRIARTLLGFSLHGGRTPPEEIPQSVPGSGVYIFRNVVDLRAPIFKSPPGKDGKPELGPVGVLFADHGSPIWPTYYVYQNTLVYHGAAVRSAYAAGLGRRMYGTSRWVFNNIFVADDAAPSMVFDQPARAELALDGNLSWSLKAKPPTGFFEKFRASAIFQQSHQRYAPGWAAHDIFADPKFTRCDGGWPNPVTLTIQAGSPAIGAGVSIPAQWPDPLRQSKPDIGAIPYGAQPEPLGIRGRLPLAISGAPSGSAATQSGIQR